MNERLKTAAFATSSTSASEIWRATNERVDNAVSYCIHASGHSLMFTTACASATAAPHMIGWRQITHRCRARANSPNAMPPTPYTTTIARAPPTPIAVFAARICS